MNSKEKRTFKIDTGSMSPKEHEDYIAQMQKTMGKLISKEEQIWIPVSGDNKVDVVTNIPKIFIEKADDTVKTPERAYPTDSGLDVFAWKFVKAYKHGNTVNDQDEFEWVIANRDNIKLDSLERVLINTGIKATVGPGYEIQVRPRSGNALKYGLTICNSPGTIDESFADYIGVILINLSNKVRTINLGDKIAQLVVAPVVLAEVEIVDKLPDTDRGLNGFGSTGK